MEMDEVAMSQTLLDALGVFAWPAVFLALGVGLGLVYFQMLRRAANLLVEGARARRVIALTLGRFALAAAALALAAMQGAAPLAAMALGVFFGRWLVLREEAARA